MEGDVTPCHIIVTGLHECFHMTKYSSVFYCICSYILCYFAFEMASVMAKLDISKEYMLEPCFSSLAA